MNKTQAPGGPGIAPRWTSSAKDGIGTAYCDGSRVWFTLSHGIVNEIYFPYVDSPNTRDLQFLISDGATFCHEEKRDLQHICERPEPDAMLYRLINRDPQGRYEIVKEIIGQPHSSVVLLSVKLHIFDRSLEGKLRLYALLAPHVQNTGGNNSARWSDFGGRHLLHAERGDVHLMFGCSTDFSRRSVGFVGTSDGWRDLTQNYQMDWQYELAENGNVAMIGEIDLAKGHEFTLGIGLGSSCQAAATALLQSFVVPFEVQRTKFIEQWKRKKLPDLVSSQEQAASRLVRMSQHVLLAHEDKTFCGATVASMSIPWGETKDDSDRGGYHLVWARDMLQTMSGLMACGELDLPLRGLVWMSCVQGKDGGMPQNSRIDGTPYWKGVQLDEVAAPVILAWRLHATDALQQFDPLTLVQRAVRFLILHGPVTAQERWEENSGYSPATLAVIISAIVCAADLMEARQGDREGAEFLRDYADWLAASLEAWTVTDRGELLPGTPRHYVRITPPSPHPECVTVDPNTARIQIANGGGEHAARNVVDAGFLQLVRYGVRAADDPTVVDSVAVIDHVLRRELPQGVCWRRYNHDGYGQRPDGSAFDGAGEGRSWPLLTGERAHYELAAGRDPTPLVGAMQRFASSGDLFPEQVWDADDLPEQQMYCGQPAGSAMPLCWAHAEYLSLMRSLRDGRVFDRIEPVYQRYVVEATSSGLEVWTLSHRIAELPQNKSLRIIVAAPASLHWSIDGWQTSHDTPLRNSSIGLHWIDLSPHDWADSSELQFTFHWVAPEHWEQTNFVVRR